jgi:hypothetical protein
VAAYAQAAIADPGRFDRSDIDLAAEALTMSEVATLLSRALHKAVRAEAVSPAEACAAGLFPGWVRSQEWTNEFGYRADIEALRTNGIPLRPFARWVEQYADQIHVAS